MTIRMTLSERVYQVGAHLIVVLVALICLVPFIYVVSISITPIRELNMRGGYVLIPSHITWAAYKLIISQGYDSPCADDYSGARAGGHVVASDYFECGGLCAVQNASARIQVFRAAGADRVLVRAGADPLLSAAAQPAHGEHVLGDGGSQARPGHGASSSSASSSWRCRPNWRRRPSLTAHRPWASFGASFFRCLCRFLPRWECLPP